jgi:hypothetical protein
MECKNEGATFQTETKKCSDNTKPVCSKTDTNLKSTCPASCTEGLKCSNDEPPAECLEEGVEISGTDSKKCEDETFAVCNRLNPDEKPTCGSESSSDTVPTEPTDPSNPTDSSSTDSGTTDSGTETPTNPGDTTTPADETGTGGSSTESPDT